MKCDKTCSAAIRQSNNNFTARISAVKIYSNHHVKKLRRHPISGTYGMFPKIGDPILTIGSILKYLQLCMIWGIPILGNLHIPTKVQSILQLGPPVWLLQKCLVHLTRFPFAALTTYEGFAPVSGHKMANLESAKIDIWKMENSPEIRIEPIKGAFQSFSNHIGGISDGISLPSGYLT